MENTAINNMGSASPTHLATPPREYLSFQLGSVEYGIDILKVQEIRGFETSTRMFNAPPYVLGVLNMRGVIVPILDMRLKFEMAEVAYNSQTVTIVLNVANRVVGMVVDAVQDVVAIQAAEVKPAPDFNGAVNTQHIIGIATVEQAEQQRMLVLLDIEKLMSSADMGLVAEANV
ncbi:chemotaxis protein CheW [Rhodoferax sp. BLA1]|uniref:chemotaxis protein CheW n=1 Tax=Rhodoferax sp. BLA1 TaxID=2576062 RepID=UPI00351AFB3F